MSDLYNSLAGYNQVVVSPRLTPRILTVEQPQIIQEQPIQELIEQPQFRPQLAPRIQQDSSKSLKQLLKEEGLNVRITSDYRPGGKTKSGHASNHSKKDKYGESMAFDIVPSDGNFEGLMQKMYSNPRILDWLKQRGYGVLEETTGDVMKKTGATGKHFHIGPDNWAKQMTNKRLGKNLYD